MLKNKEVEYENNAYGKGGAGTLSIEEIEKMIDLAVHKGREIRKLIKQE